MHISDIRVLATTRLLYMNLDLNLETISEPQNYRLFPPVGGDRRTPKGVRPVQAVPRRNGP